MYYLLFKWEISDEVSFYFLVNFYIYKSKLQVLIRDKAYCSWSKICTKLKASFKKAVTQNNYLKKLDEQISIETRWTNARNRIASIIEIAVT